MDVRLHSKPQPRYAVNGGVGQNSRPGDADLLSLSQDVQECIQFFDETIVSLEESLQEEDRSTGQAKPPASSHGPVDRVGGPLTFSHSPMSSVLASPPSPKDQDIIDLVHPEPVLLQQPIFSPTSPGFPRITPAPESHFEIKPRRDHPDSLPSEYNPPLPSGSYGPTDSYSLYHPPGCIPTPALIAQKIAENKTSGTSNLLPSSLHRRQSVESDKSHGPPTFSKPTRFPANISVVHTNKDHHSQTGANVNIHDRQAQMLANLTGTSHYLTQEDPQQAAEQLSRNAPTRSISFKDPAPDVSRMEALSKLGLNRTRAMSGGMSPHASSTTLDPLPGVQPSAKLLEASLPPTTETSTKANVTRPLQSQTKVERKPEVLPTDSLKNYENRNPQPSPPHSVTRSSFNPPLEHKAPVSPPPEVTANSYGGKSVFVHPSVYSKTEPATSPTSPGPNITPQALSNPSEFNTYRGKSKVMTPVSVAVTSNNLPDILSSHLDKSQTFPAKSEPPPTDINSYGGRSRTFNPVKSLKAPAPTPAPKPQRHTIHIAAQKPAPRASSPEHRRKPTSKFRPQGITVEFSGRGPMNDSRREALRKLGLLKES